jgi:hypothetical protein
MTSPATNHRFAPALLVAMTLALAACKAQAPTPPAEAQAPPATPQVTADTSAQPARSTDAPLPSEDASLAPAATAALPAAFVDKVWKVGKSSAVEPGTTYTFLADGTLVIDSPNGTPMHGRWSYDKGALVMVEEGISYPTEIIAIDATKFHIRSHNPGEPVDIELVPAPDQPLPKP